MASHKPHHAATGGRGVLISILFQQEMSQKFSSQ